MVTLRQDSRGNYSARKRLPDDVREEYGKLYRARFEAKFSARGSLGKEAAQQKFHQWATEVEQRIEAIRKAQRGEGIDLDREQAAALAGEWYLWFVAKYEKEDADPEAYEEALWDIIDEMLNFAPDEVRERPLRDMRWARDPEVGRSACYCRPRAYSAIPREPGPRSDQQGSCAIPRPRAGQLRAGTVAVGASRQGRL